jgi:hypothetical protein
VGGRGFRDRSAPAGRDGGACQWQEMLSEVAVAVAQVRVTVSYAVTVPGDELFATNKTAWVVDAVDMADEADAGPAAATVATAPAGTVSNRAVRPAVSRREPIRRGPRRVNAGMDKVGVLFRRGPARRLRRDRSLPTFHQAVRCERTNAPFTPAHGSRGIYATARMADL